MAVSTEIVARKYINPVAGTAISVDIPATDKTTISVLMCNIGTEAVRDTDYTVTLNDADYSDFTITPTSSMRTKIDAIKAGDATEADYIVVRRTLNYLSDMTSALAFMRTKIATEFDKATMRFQQIAETLKRCVMRAENDIAATGAITLPLSGTLANKALIFDDNENLRVSTMDFEDAAVYAAEASASAAAAAASQSASSSSQIAAAASATAAANSAASITLPLPVTSGGTGSNTAAAARTALGIYSKSETDTLLSAKAPLASPGLTGVPTSPTAASGTNTTQIATCEFVTSHPTINQANLVGVADASSANAGSVGELISSLVTSPGSGISSGVFFNITSLALTPGDWEVSATACYAPAASTVITSSMSCVGTASATPGTAGTSGRSAWRGSITGGIPLELPSGPTRISVSSNTTVYLVGYCQFTTSTCTAYGEIRARRVR